LKIEARRGSQFQSRASNVTARRSHTQAHWRLAGGIILLRNPDSRRNPTFRGIPFKCLLRTPSDVNRTPGSAIIIYSEFLMGCCATSRFSHSFSNITQLEAITPGTQAKILGVHLFLEFHRRAITVCLEWSQVPFRSFCLATAALLQSVY
jgi:hypothetical protein